MQIIYQDKRIVVAVKPRGVISTEVRGGMPQLLRQELQTECIRTVHRLDAQVSGLMVLARSAAAASILSRQIRDQEFGKVYLAVVHGCPEAPRGTLRDLLRRDKSARKTFVAQEDEPGGKEAILDYEVLASREGFSLVRICLQTGRTHQIRVQFASRGMPLAGDRKYGLPEDTCPIALWSYQLSFRHPETEEPLLFRLLPPEIAPWTNFSTELQEMDKTGC